MSAKLEFTIGTSFEDINHDIVAKAHAALKAAERGEPVRASRTIRFENWPTFFRTMTPNRIAILEFVSAHEVVQSTRALTKALNRDYAAVHADVAELVRLGLLGRDGNALRCEVEFSEASITSDDENASKRA